MAIFCTIITPDFIPFAQCLANSLRTYYPGMVLHVLVTGEQLPVQEEGMKFYSEEMLNSDSARKIRNKYPVHSDALRWSLKPIFLLKLLEENEQVLYMDCDLHFFSSPQFISDLLNEHSFLLTPHFACLDPFKNEEKFKMNFLAGLYNAGFIGVNRKAIPSLEWWAMACLYKNENDTANGFYVDQRYLDLIPVIDEHAHVLHHPGCNVGSWSMESFAREMQPDGSVLIAGKYPVVFMHFNHETIRHILNGNDGNLMGYYRQYEAAFRATGHALNDFIHPLEAWKSRGMMSRIKQKTSLRTRLKSFLYQLAKKI